MSLSETSYSSLQELVQSVTATGFNYVSKNTNYDGNAYLRCFTLKCERFGEYKPTGKTSKKTTSKKCGCKSLIHGSVDIDEAGVRIYKIASHIAAHNHEKPTVTLTPKLVDHAASTSHKVCTSSANIRDNATSSAPVVEATITNKVHAIPKSSDNTSVSNNSNPASKQEHEPVYSNSKQESFASGEPEDKESVKTILRKIRMSYRELADENKTTGYIMIQNFSREFEDFLELCKRTEQLPMKKDFPPFATEPMSHELDAADKTAEIVGNFDVSPKYLKNNDKDSVAAEKIDKKKLEVFASSSSQEKKNKQSLDNHVIESENSKNDNKTSKLKSTDQFKKVKPCGRPRKEGKTALGLDQRTMPPNWDDKTLGQRVSTMLNWIPMKPVLRKSVLDNEYVLQTKNLINTEEWITPFLSDRCDVSTIKGYFTTDGFNHFNKQILAAKKKMLDSTCHYCYRSLNGTSIDCDGCLLWYDAKCVGLKDPVTPSLTWFCPECSEKFN